MNHSGYQRDRFPNLPHDSFECIICSQVVQQPWECHSCGKMFCKLCITNWMTKNPTAKCPSRCANSKIANITSKALMKLYHDLDIKCSNPKCEKLVKLFDLKKHQGVCLKVKCWNFQNCQKAQDQDISSKQPCCSVTCEIVLRIIESYGNNKKTYQIIDEFFKSQSIEEQPTLTKNASLSEIGWDPTKMGTNVVITQNGGHIFLKEQSYVFRSAVANVGFTGGRNYWEIIADPKTQNQLKIGVTGSKDFDINSAFCDNAFGFAYYGLGQLRHGSNASGQAFGKRFKKEGILGICLNMQTGTLSFALNGQYWGVAFTDPKLKVGPIYPAVSLLHCAGCKIRSGMKIPSYFKD